MNKKPRYTVEEAMADLGEAPNKDEVERLAKYYTSYQVKKHRKGFLQGVFEHKSIGQLALDKSNNVDFKGEVTNQHLGGHAKWVVAKLRTMVIRFLYLRYFLDEGLSRIKSNSAILQHKILFVDPDNVQSVKSTIRKATLFPQKKS